MPNGEKADAIFNVPLLYTQEHTHCEIDPQLVWVYVLHDSISRTQLTPRVTGGTAMVKQSLGLPSSNYRLRPD